MNSVPLVSTFFESLEPKVSNVRYLEVAGRHNGSDHDALRRIARKGQKLEEIVLPYRLDLQVDELDEKCCTNWQLCQ